MRKCVVPRYKGLVFMISFLLYSLPCIAQDTTACRHMFRVYEDNDVIKLLGNISDKGYTNGTRFDYFFTTSQPARFFLNKYLPKAGKQAVNTMGISVMQTMFTPEDYRTTMPDTRDWPYTGALFAAYSLHSSNPQKKYNLQTEISAGVMGKASMAEQVQKFIHQLTGSEKPMGWDKQYPTDLLLNISLTAEKQLWHYSRFVEVIAGGQATAGTMLNGATIYGTLRTGWMLPYFAGFISQYAQPFRQRNPLQLYLVARPSLSWVGYNAVLEGGVLNGRSDYYETADRAQVNHSISRQLDLGVVLGYGCISFSFTQRIMPKQVDGFAHERLGNFSMHIAW